MGLHVKYPLLLSDVNETLIFRHIFKNFSSIKFHENPFRESRVFSPVRAGGRADRQT